MLKVIRMWHGTSRTAISRTLTEVVAIVGHQLVRAILLVHDVLEYNECVAILMALVLSRMQMD